jgi:hypothetical protein
MSSARPPPSRSKAKNHISAFFIFERAVIAVGLATPLPWLPLNTMRKPPQIVENVSILERLSFASYIAKASTRLLA